jgi:hypothetical protein
MGRTLDKSKLPLGSTGFLHKGIVYVPGDDGKARDIHGNEIELPDDFPSDADLDENLRRASGPGGSMAPLTKAADGREVGDFESMNKDELQAEAEKRGLAVKRGDGEEGDPLKADYVKALNKAAGKGK